MTPDQIEMARFLILCMVVGGLALLADPFLRRH